MHWDIRPGGIELELKNKNNTMETNKLEMIKGADVSLLRDEFSLYIRR